MLRKDLRKNIIATIAYYDVFDYPLTKFELWRYLIDVSEEGGGGCLISDVEEELNNERIRRIIDSENGFFFLRGQNSLVEKRILRNKISVAKILKMKKYVWAMRFLPYIRMVAITGKVAMKNASIGSDWDLLVILKEGKIWTGRTFLTIFTQIIGKRRYGRKIKDRFCLNYFISEKHLEISTKDFYAANEYSFILPIFDVGIFEKFQDQNKWIKKIKPNYIEKSPNNMKLLKDDWLSIWLRSFFEKLFNFDFIEKILGDLEKKKIMENPKTRLEGSYIEATNEALVFLPEPQGPRVFENFKERVKSIDF